MPPYGTSPLRRWSRAFRSTRQDAEKAADDYAKIH
jgi:hypothetical protein